MNRISTGTLAYYDDNADGFWRGTRDHDVRQNIAALLSHIEGPPPFTPLDLGCGPGRDLKALADLGHRPVGLDGAARFAAMAAAYSGCPVWHRDFLRLDLPDDHFAGIFANGALFHVPADALPRVLAELHASRKPGGAVFASNPHGRDEGGWRGGRFGCFHHPDTWRRHCTRAGFVELDCYYRPAGLPREQQPWLATVWRKAGIA
ncbi:MAG: class I SAM-dependent methyltransferase [Rhodocyclaceae bacterium]|nr:class I SAM-dependent methyltransferase [Rhodocyclaceae bacterium]